MSNSSIRKMLCSSIIGNKLRDTYSDTSLSNDEVSIGELSDILDYKFIYNKFSKFKRSKVKISDVIGIIETELKKKVSSRRFQR